MSRKRCHRRAVQPLPPRGLRPKLDPAQLTDLAQLHTGHLDMIARGLAVEETLWQTVAAIFTWSRVAQLLGVGVDEMAAQLWLGEQLIHRYKRTGRVGFSGQEYQIAKTGVMVMDSLAEIVDLPTARVAAEWSEQHTNRLLAAHQSRREAA